MIRRSVLRVAGVLSVLAMTAACGGADDTSTAEAAAGSGPQPTATAGATGDVSTTQVPPSSVPPEGEIGQNVAGSQPVTTSAGASPPAPDPPPAGGGVDPTPPPAPSPEPADPAAAGLYRYATDGTTQVSNGPQRPMPDVTTLTVDPQEGTRQRSVRDMRDRDGIGGVTEQILDYAPGGVHLAYLKLQTSVAGVTNTYEFTPSEPSLIVRTGTAEGETTTFTLEGDGVTITTTATILRTESVTIDGTTVSALVLELRSTLSGRLQGTQVAVSWIDPERSLTVREDVQTDVTQGAVRVRSDYEATLTSLSPG